MQWAGALAAVRDGATLVTANARLARRTIEEQARTTPESATWTGGRVMDWAGWLRELHAEALVCGAIAAPDFAALPNPAQVAALWQRVIDEDPGPFRERLLQPGAMVEPALEAHELCQAWRLDPSSFHAVSSQEDVLAFQRWEDRYFALLAESGWLDPARLPDLAAGWLASTPGLRPASLLLAGFAEFTPQQQALLNELVGLGVSVTLVDTGRAPASRASRVACPDKLEETRLAARWARERLLDKPGQSLAIIVPELAGRRSMLEAELAAALEPAACHNPAQPRMRPFNISLGLPLEQSPPVHDALLLLELLHEPLDFSLTSRLLRSPFLGAAEEEQAGRAALELRLRRWREFGADRHTLARLAGRPDREGEALAARLAGLLARMEPRTGRQLPSSWAETFASELAQLGWPGERSLDSMEYQAVEAFGELLQSFATLDAVLTPQDRAGAIARLRRLAGARLFQPRVPGGAVQVLGVLEALGQHFDGTWVMGLHAEAWPPPARPNPFIPLILQRDAGLPRSSARRELSFARRLHEHLLSTADEVVLSWPERDGEEPLRPSPLITGVALAELVPEKLPSMVPAPLQAAPLEAPALDPGRTQSGGVQVLADQAQCPFRAFARHRLAALPVDPPELGPDAATRGSLVHALMDKLWETLGSQQALRALPPSGRLALVRATVEDVVAGTGPSVPALRSPRLRQLECERLARLVDTWLDHELERPPFRVIAREEPRELSLGGLKLALRVDRIDQTESGSSLLIDYKTGNIRLGNLTGDRPADPQLLVYQAASGPELAGVLIARVRTDKPGWLGVVADPELCLAREVSAPGNSRLPAGDWGELRAGWTRAVESLAAEFLRGVADVDPRPGACDYCHLAGLCRVHSRGGSFAGPVTAQDERDD
ncbi:MAG: PD-(D/E)XK nuclease family protein [Chromatiales bacterium]|nr:PD-(D/E)XK nuclease family protein [Chromatiales bacterium]